MAARRDVRGSRRLLHYRASHVAKAAPLQAVGSDVIAACHFFAWFFVSLIATVPGPAAAGAMPAFTALTGARQSVDRAAVFFPAIGGQTWFTFSFHPIF